MRARTLEGGNEEACKAVQAVAASQVAKRARIDFRRTNSDETAESPVLAEPAAELREAGIGRAEG